MRARVPTMRTQGKGSTTPGGSFRDGGSWRPSCFNRSSMVGMGSLVNRFGKSTVAGAGRSTPRRALPAERIQSIEGAQFGVQARVFRREFARALEEDLGHHGKELR